MNNWTKISIFSVQHGHPLSKYYEATTSFGPQNSQWPAHPRIFLRLHTHAIFCYLCSNGWHFASTATDKFSPPHAILQLKLAIQLPTIGLLLRSDDRVYTYQCTVHVLQKLSYNKQRWRVGKKNCPAHGLDVFWMPMIWTCIWACIVHAQNDSRIWPPTLYTTQYKN